MGLLRRKVRVKPVPLHMLGLYEMRLPDIEVMQAHSESVQTVASLAASIAQGGIEPELLEALERTAPQVRIGCGAPT